MRFHKYQALGNDYLILDTPDIAGNLGVETIRTLCDRHFGIGADGVLLEIPAPSGIFALRILNLDGSEAEKSGNGLRIFARYLWDSGRAGDEKFSVLTKGGPVRCQVLELGQTVLVEMGTASFDSARIPVAGHPREVVGEAIQVEGQQLSFTAVTVGNPHCVVHVDEISAELARRLGPLLETHALFPNRTNVQFVQVLGPRLIRVEIWERGAGYTLASGTSGCAAAAASVRLGLCDSDIIVRMPGGELEIGVAKDWTLTMLGPVRKVAEGTVSPELLRNKR